MGAGMVLAAALGASSVVSAGVAPVLEVSPSTVDAGDSINVRVVCFTDPEIYVQGADGTPVALDGFDRPMGSTWVLDHPTDGAATEDHQLTFSGTCGEFQFDQQVVTVLAQAATTTSTSTTSTSVPGPTTSIAPSTTVPAASPTAATPAAPASPQRAQPTYTG